MRFLLLIALSACVPNLPAPAMTSQRTSALVAVPYPPPPAHVEAVPDTPKEKAVWIDGEWLWRNKRWMWQRGRWIPVPNGGTYSPWTVVRDRDGNLYWAKGVWHAANGEELEEPKPLAVGADVVGSVIDSEGNTIEQGRVLQPPGERKK